MNTSNSEKAFETSSRLFPGGVNSPVRAFNAVDGPPRFIEKGAGPYIYDIDDNRYIDHCCSWGPLIHGHAHPEVLDAVNRTMRKGLSFGACTELESKLGELIVAHHWMDQLRFVNSGTEATMSAIRLARGFTGRDLIVKFDGCYHGHADHLLVSAGSGLATFGTASSAGVPAAFAEQTIVLPLDDETALNTCFEQHKNQIACVIIEPVPANNGLLLQRKEYLEYLGALCSSHDTLLIFDEVISGFRVGFAGAADYYGITPDLGTYGKIIGGGLPVGAYGGKKEIMNMIAPDGPVYQAGTLSGNPVAMAAGIAQLNICLKDGFYLRLEKKTKALTDKVNGFIEAHGYEARMHGIASIFWLSFGADTVFRKASDIHPESMDSFRKYYSAILDGGVYLGPSGYEVGFISSAHDDSVLDASAQIICNAIRSVFE